jgi:hypothetical protein
VQTKPRSRKHGTASEGHDGDYHNDDDDDEKEQDVHYNSAADVVQRIVSEDGLSGLYRGIAGSLIGVASTNFAYFYWYSVVRTLYVSTSRKQQRRDGRRHSTRLAPPPSLDTSAELALGALAGALAQLFTIPVSVITTRQQTQKKGEAKGLIETGKEVVSGDDGVRGLWRGLKASLVLVANPAITYAAYQRLRQALFPGKARLRPWQAFGMLIPPPRIGLWNTVGWSAVTLMRDLREVWSSRSAKQGYRHGSHAAAHRSQGWAAIAPATGQAAAAFPGLCGSDTIYRAARRCAGAL